jgi:hypothetical protein
MRKNLIKLSLILLPILILTNCGFMPSGYLGHSTNTQVILQEANFKVINSVRGQATASFILGIGPSQSHLYARAKRNMLESANLSGGGTKSRALINFTTDEQIKYFALYIFPVYFSKTVYITADVVEFK